MSAARLSTTDCARISGTKRSPRIKRGPLKRIAVSWRRSASRISQCTCEHPVSCTTRSIFLKATRRVRTAESGQRRFFNDNLVTRHPLHGEQRVAVDQLRLHQLNAKRYQPSWANNTDPQNRRAYGLLQTAPPLPFRRASPSPCAPRHRSRNQARCEPRRRGKGMAIPPPAGARQGQTWGSRARVRAWHPPPCGRGTRSGCSRGQDAHSRI